MNRIVLAALVVSSSAVFPLAVEAQTGFLCGFGSITDPTVEGDVQTGVIDGGPLFAADVDNPGEETANISIRCTIQVGAQGATHAGADAYSAEGPTQAGVAVLPAHQFSYVAPEGAPTYICTEAEVNGQIRYFNETEDDATRGWSTSSASACALSLSQEIDEPAGPVDAVVIVAPPDGSEPIHTNTSAWDCSSYTWNPSTRLYEVTCFSSGTPCNLVRLTAMGSLGTVIATTFCQDGTVAKAVSPGVAVATGGASVWRCAGVFLSSGQVQCVVETT